MVPRLAALALATVIIAGQAHAQAPRRVDELMQKSGMNSLLVQLEKAILTEMERAAETTVDLGIGRPLTADDRTRLAATVSSSFNAARMKQEVKASLQKSMTAPDENVVLAWLDTDFGRRIVATDTSYHAATMSMPQQQYYDDVMRARKGITQDRADLLKRLGSALSEGEANARMRTNMTASVFFGVMSAMDMSVNEIELAKKTLEARRGVMAHAARQGAVARFAHQYQALDDSQLEKLVTFAESPAGLRYYDAMEAALEGSITRASLDFGRQYAEFDKARKKK
ncbi:hypothetical protein BWI17_02050 [Betaproteobacteria bacterium GR16-43]|nr:hypothetical protein BWI17_02050 [Betaproteobacteria bacterium GR16-43]